MKAIPIRSAAFSILVAAAAPAAADDVHCPPHLGEVTIDGNVLVAAACELDGTTVKGNVHLYAGGSLTATNVRIDGNVQADTSDFVSIVGSQIGGDIQLDDLVGDLSVVSETDVGGSIQIVRNRSRTELTDNVVDADIQLFDNSGGVVIARNVVGGNLQCKSNEPVPTGGDNDVSGNKEDQCENLAAADTVAGTVTGSAGTDGGGTDAGASADNVGAAESTGGGGGTGPLAALLLGVAALLRRVLRAQ